MDVEKLEKELSKLDHNRFYPALGAESLAQVVEVLIATRRKQAEATSKGYGKDNTEPNKMNNGGELSSHKCTRVETGRDLKKKEKSVQSQKSEFAEHRKAASSNSESIMSIDKNLINPDNSILKKEVREFAKNRCHSQFKKGEKEDSWAEKLQMEVEEKVRGFPTNSLINSTQFLPYPITLNQKIYAYTY
uniref:RPAP1_N domain-containing protein n=1 Tax=Globodera pallida TaxID=36090 RepID=A0A183BQB1_GLOPA